MKQSFFMNDLLVVKDNNTRASGLLRLTGSFSLWVAHPKVLVVRSASGEMRGSVFGNYQKFVMSGTPVKTNGWRAVKIAGAWRKHFMSRGGIIGVSDHGGWAVLVTADGDGKLLDRRRVGLVEEGLPKIPHHSEGQFLPIDEAVKLVERVHASAERHSKLVLEAVATEVSGSILGIALRQYPELPPTISERITNYRAQNVADWVMYRKALAAAAEARGWPVHWFHLRQVQAMASKALGV
jgi:hypothetical protein